MRRAPRRLGLFALVLGSLLAPTATRAALTPTLYLVDYLVDNVTWVVPAVIAKRYAYGDPDAAEAIPFQFAPARRKADPPSAMERRWTRTYLGEGPRQPQTMKMRTFMGFVPDVEKPILQQDARPPRFRDRYRLMFPLSDAEGGIDYELSLPSGGDGRTYYLRPKGYLPGFAEQNFAYATRDFRSARDLFARDAEGRNLTPTTAPISSGAVIELPGDPWELTPGPGTVNAYVGDGSSTTVVFHYSEGLAPAPLLAVDTGLFDDEIDASHKLMYEVQQLAARLDAGGDARGDPLLATIEAQAARGATLGPRELTDLALAARRREQASREGSKLLDVLRNSGVLYAAFNRREVRAYRAFVPRTNGEALVTLNLQSLTEPELRRVASNAIDTTRAPAYYKLGNDPEYWFEGVTPFGGLLLRPGYRGVETRGEGAPRYYRVANKDQTRYFSKRVEAWQADVAPPAASAHFGPRDWTPPTGFEPIGFAEVADGGVRYPAELRARVDGSRFVLVSGVGKPFYIQAFEVTFGQWVDFLEQLEPDLEKELLARKSEVKEMEPARVNTVFEALEDRQKVAARYFLPREEVTERGASLGRRVSLGRTRAGNRPSRTNASKNPTRAGPSRTNPTQAIRVRPSNRRQPARVAPLPQEYLDVFDDLVQIRKNQPVRGIRPLDAYDLYGAWIGGAADVRLPSDAEWRAALPAAHPGLLVKPLLPMPAAGLLEPLTKRELDDYPADRSWSGARGLRGNVPEWTIAEAPREAGGEVELHLRGVAWNDNAMGSDDPHDGSAADAAETGALVAGFRLVLIPDLP